MNWLMPKAAGNDRVERNLVPDQGANFLKARNAFLPVFLAVLPAFLPEFETAVERGIECASRFRKQRKRGRVLNASNEIVGPFTGFGNHAINGDVHNLSNLTKPTP